MKRFIVFYLLLACAEYCFAERIRYSIELHRDSAVVTTKTKETTVSETIQMSFDEKRLCRYLQFDLESTGGKNISVNVILGNQISLNEAFPSGHKHLGKKIYWRNDDLYGCDYIELRYVYSDELDIFQKKVFQEQKDDRIKELTEKYKDASAIEFEADDDTPIIGQVTRRDKKISDALVRCGLHSEYEDGHYVQRLYISEPMTVRVSQDVYDEALRQINLTNLYMTPVRRHQRRH